MMITTTVSHLRPGEITVIEQFGGEWCFWSYWRAGLQAQTGSAVSFRQARTSIQEARAANAVAITDAELEAAERSVQK